MTPTQLLMPRYKVEADYPGSQFKVGQIIQMIEMRECFFKMNDAGTDLDNTKYWHSDFIEHETEYVSYCELNLSPYPHLFRRMDWHEDRELSDMPEYVKIDGQIVKVLNYVDAKYCEGGKSMFYYEWINKLGQMDDLCRYVHHCTPATAEEYQDYINNKK